MDYVTKAIAMARPLVAALSSPRAVQIYSHGALLLVLLTFILYLVPQFILAIFFSRPQNLKKKYNAEWALVTGASSGIGKSLALGLAAQGLHVVLVALPETTFDATFDEICALYPKQKFVKCETNLGTPGYMEDIIAATKRLKVQLVFCNAGYMLTGFFHKNSIEKQMMNYECNATSAVQITHHFLELLVKKNLTGCFVYTSSAAAMMPSPFTVLYAATKSFLSSFGASLAAEVHHRGIDVCVIHPSPVATRFYDKAHKLDMLDFFKGFSVSPDVLPSVIFGAIGRTVFRDIGGTAVCFRMLMKVMDYNFMATLTARLASTMPDFKRHMAKEK